MRLNATSSLRRQLVTELLKPPTIKGVAERLAVVYARFASESTHSVVVAVDFQMLPDHAYVSGPDAANFDVRWLVQAGQDADSRNCGILLAHLHEHRGRPWFSPPDLRTIREVIYPLYRMSPQVPQGALLFSLDRAVAMIAASNGFVSVRNVTFVR